MTVASLLTEDDIERFHRDGVIVVRGLFTSDEVATIESGIERVLADPGPMFKRHRPRARGMAFEIKRRMSHIKVALDAPAAGDGGAK